MLEIIQKVDLPVALAKKITDRIEYNANYFITGTPALEPQVVTDHSNNEIFVRSQFLEDQTTGRLRFRYRAPRNVASPAIDPIVLERIFRVALGVPHPNLALRARWAHSQAPKRTQQPAIFPIRGDLSKMVIFQNGRWLTFRRVQEGSGQEIYYECVANESTPPPELIRLTEQSETTELGARRYTPDELLRLIYDQRQRQDGELVPTNYSGTITDQQDLRETEPSPQQHSSIVLEGLERSWADLTFHELGVPTSKNKETPNWERHFNHHFNNGVYEIDERRQVKIKGAHTLEAFQKVIRKINDRLASDDLRVTGVRPGQPVTFRLSADSDSPIFYSYQITYRAGRGPTRVKSILSPVPLDHVAHHVETAVHEEFQDLAASVPPALRAAFNGAVHKFYYLAWREALSAAWRNPTPTSYSFTVPALDGFNNPIDLEMKASPNEYLKETLAAQARLTLSQRRGQLPPNLSTVELFGFDTIYPAPVAP